MPKKQVLSHTALLRASLQSELRKAQGELQQADMALTLAAEDRDDAIAFAKQKYDAIRTEVDAERNDIIMSIDGITAALTATAPKADTMAQVADGGQNGQEQ